MKGRVRPKKSISGEAVCVDCNTVDLAKMQTMAKGSKRKKIAVVTWEWPLR